MDKYYKYIIIGFLVVGIVLVGVFVYQNLTYDYTPNDQAQAIVPTQEPVLEGENVVVAEDTNEVDAAAKFWKVENGKIYAQNDQGGKVYMVNSDTIVLMCTSQDLDGAKAVDFDQVNSNKQINFTEFTDYVEPNQYFVALSLEDVDGYFYTYAVMVNSNVCGVTQ